MTTKHVGLGSAVYVDHDDDATFTLVGQSSQITPPGRTREDVDATVLADTLEVPEPGIEAKSEFEFTQVWHPGDTNHEILDTLFASEAKVDWRVVYPTSVGKRDTFEGYVKQLGPEQIDTKSAIKRKVVVQRTGAITRATDS